MISTHIGVGPGFLILSCIMAMGCTILEPAKIHPDLRRADRTGTPVKLGATEEEVLALIGDPYRIYGRHIWIYETYITTSEGIMYDHCILWLPAGKVSLIKAVTSREVEDIVSELEKK